MAGIRLHEVARLTWEGVFRVKGHVEISTAKSKTRSRRLVTVCPALARWLNRYRDRSGLVWPLALDRWYDEFNALLDSLSIPAKRNALRHGFCTYHFA